MTNTAHTPTRTMTKREQVEFDNYNTAMRARAAYFAKYDDLIEQARVEREVNND